MLLHDRGLPIKRGWTPVHRVVLLSEMDVFWLAMAEFSRRDFLRAGVGAGATAAFGKRSLSWPTLCRADGLSASDGLAPESDGRLPQSPSWVDKPMRWAQLTL